MDSTWELYDMFQAVMNAPSYHLALEGFLFLWVLWLLFHKSYKPESKKLTKQEEEELIAEWTPEPLVSDSSDHFSQKPKVLSGKTGKYMSVNGKKCLNMGTYNYLGLVESPELEEAAVKALRKYGVGSCGPRGFYGTVDIHLDLEEKISQFMGVEETALYSFGYVTISSAIPAYSKLGDVIFCDESVNYNIQKGLLVSRSSLRFFKHNDVEDLERLLDEQAELDKQNPKKAKVTRRFLVVEGIYANVGDICPLPKLVELKNKFKLRLFIDESHSFGVLGKTGKGVTEHFGIPPSEFDLITASLEYAAASYGGFACGTFYVVDHQRLAALGYCYSASLPPLQAAAAIAALDFLENNTGITSTLQRNARIMHKKLQSIPEIIVEAEEICPLKYIYLADSEIEDDEAVKLLEKIVDYAMDKEIALTIGRFLPDERLHFSPRIRLIVNVQLQDDEMTKVAEVLSEACKQLL